MRYASGGIEDPGLTIDTEDLLNGQEIARSDVIEAIGTLSLLGSYNDGDISSPDP